MKITTLITAAGSVSAIAFAGEPAPMAPAPAPAPTLGGWFVGGTYGQFEAGSNVANLLNEADPNGYGFGYLAGDTQETLSSRAVVYRRGYKIEDFEFDMYTLHVGRDLGVQFLGCDLAAYLEVGYIAGDATVSLYQSFGPKLDSAIIDLDIIPITINLKAEREFFAGIKGYVSIGAGYAFTKAKFLGEHESDGGFYAQAQAGLAYDINENWEIFGGARFLYLDDLDFGIDGATLDNSVAYEIGLRYNF